MKTASEVLNVVGMALAIAAMATPAGAADIAGAPTNARSPAGEAQALRVVRDKESGKLRAPNDEELKAMLDNEQAARRSRGQAEPSATKTPLAIREHANGMKSAVLGAEFRATLKAERDASGKIVTKHADSAHDHAVALPKLPTE